VIRAVLFDFGGVILSSPFEAFRRYEDEIGLPPNTIRTINATNPETNTWAQFERGELEVEAFADAFEHEAAGHGVVLDGHRVLGSLRGVLRPAMVEALRRCSAQFATALLTNNFRPVSSGGNDVMVDGDGQSVAQVMEVFDVILESSVIGVRKPEPEFYRLACERLGVEPSDCVFLDDLGINLKPARAMGMYTIKVEDPADAIAELERLLGIPLS